MDSGPVHAGRHEQNLLFQSEEHPLVPDRTESAEQHVLSLIHLYAYHYAASRAEGLEVLDLGCNNGYGTAVLADRADRITGVDVSRRAIEAALRRKRPNTELMTVDGDSLPFDADSFDLVTSFQVIEHVVNIDRYLSEIRRVLRPDGRFILSTPNAAIRLDPGMKPWNKFHVREYLPDELEAALGRTFPDVRVLGLTSRPEIYDVELQRVSRAREKARRSRSLVRRMLPLRLKRLARIGRKRPEPTRRAGDYRSWDWSDLYTVEGDERLSALDLIAECR